MSEWISVKDRLPPQGIKIKIKAQYQDHEVVEANCIFKIMDIDEFNEAWRWIFDPGEQQKYGTLRPTHWKLNAPKEGG